MKVLYWITTATLLLTAVIAICFCVPLARKPREVVRGAPEDGTDESRGGGAAVVELCRRGLVLLGQEENTSTDSSDTTESGGAMVQGAWVHQSQYPAVVPKIWAMTKDWAATLPLDRRYLTLTLYLQSVNDAIDSCKMPDDFDLLWQVRKQVTSLIEEVEQNRITSLSRELEKLIKEVNDKGVEQCLLSADSLKNHEDVRAKVETLSESSDDLPKAIRDHLQTVRKAVSSWFDNRVVAIEKRYTTERHRDAYAEGEIAPENGAEKNIRKRGQYAQLLADVELVWAKRMSPEAQFWMQSTLNTTANARGDSPPEDVKEKSRSFDQRLNKLRSDIIRSVRIRYNMWAVKQIYQAGRIAAPQGCEALGRIDNGLLDPSVSALYSTTESQVLNSIRDAFQLTVQVRKMLLIEPVGLDAF